MTGAILCPAAQTEFWRSNFIGTTRLSVTTTHYLISVWATDTYRLRLTEIHRLGLKTPICRLSPVGPGHYRGALVLAHADFPRHFMVRVDLQETDQGWLEIRFDAVARRAEQ